jgi:CoA transferase family III
MAHTVLMHESNHIPLAAAADEALRRLARASGSDALAALHGETLLCERAMMRGMRIPGRSSAGGQCKLLDASGDTVALNLPRATDRELLPALLESDELDISDDADIRARIAQIPATTLVARGRSLGLAIASEHEMLRSATSATATSMDIGYAELLPGQPSATVARAAPRVVDLSALWAGPLAAHLLWLAGAEVVKVESRGRPDAMRQGEDGNFYALLNQGKASVVLNFANESDRRSLLSLIAQADIVIEAARPRALEQLGIDAGEVVRKTPGLVWITITGHGALGPSGDWIGFGDDCGVAGGLSAALRVACGRTGFVGDAIADPLTGIFAALAAWETWKARRGGRFGLAMSRVVEHCLTWENREHPSELTTSLRNWSNCVGTAFPTVAQRSIGTLPAFGENTQAYLSHLTR